ncbi:MAG TPA: hypothetical protein VK421_12845 [Pyrinomonadaceae bacterium]|nr:hypothetical protein [Pyrinomonadaceae bacterium]
MRQKLGVALAVAAFALSGARGASDQFRQLKSLAGDWANTNAWNSLLVYAAGTFDGLVPQRQTALVASNSAACGDAKATTARRAARPARKPVRVKVEEARPVIAELALSHAEAAAGSSEVEEFRIEIGRDAGETTEALIPRFAATVFETEVARESGADAARVRLASEVSKLWGKEFVFQFTPAETPRGRAALRRSATRRKADERRVEATDAELDADAIETLFEAPSGTGLLNCDEEPRR